MLLALEHLSRRIGRDVLEVQMGELAVAQQLEVFELARARPEMKRVEHHPHVGVIRFTHDSSSADGSVPASVDVFVNSSISVTP